MNIRITKGIGAWPTLCVIGALAVVMGLPARAASFDCTKAGTKVELMVCDNPVISELDDKLSKAYTAALSNEEQADVIRKEQRKWLDERNGCGELMHQTTPLWCLLNAYTNRLKQLGLSPSEIDPNRKEKRGERHRYFINDEDERIGDESESRPLCRAVLAALIKTQPSATHRACIAEELLKLAGVSDPAWQKLDLSKHEELVKKMFALGAVGSVEYFRKQKLYPEKYPKPEQLQRRLDNVKKIGAELFVMRQPNTLSGDPVIVTLRYKSSGCGRPHEVLGEETHGVWATPDLQDIATTTGSAFAGRPFTYRGRLYTMRPMGGGDAVELGLPGRGYSGTICSISITID